MDYYSLADLGGERKVELWPCRLNGVDSWIIGQLPVQSAVRRRIGKVRWRVPTIVVVDSWRTRDMYPKIQSGAITDTDVSFCWLCAYVCVW